jgi:hypothetical protein
MSGWAVAEKGRNRRSGLRKRKSVPIAETLQKVNQHSSLGAGKIRNRFLHVDSVLRESFGDQVAALAGQFDDSNPAVGGMVFANDKPLAFEPVNGSRNGSRRQVDHLTDDVHRERALMQQRLEDTEVRVAKIDSLYARFGIREQGPVSLPDNQEYVGSITLSRFLCLNVHEKDCRGNVS